MATHVTAIPGHRDTSLLTSNFRNIFQFVKKYGNVISLDFGIKSAVIISSLPLIKEAFSHLDENFINRRIFPLQRQIFNGNGKSFMCCKICIVMFMIHKGTYMPYLSNRHINLHERLSLMRAGCHLSWMKSPNRWLILGPSKDCAQPPVLQKYL